MKLLLDTHIWLWSQLEPARLGVQARRALEDAENEIWVSPISAWEILTLVRKGRLQLDRAADAWVAESLRRCGFRQAALTHEVALATSAITLPHTDPADAFLAATARTFALTLVTADAQILQGKGFTVLPN